MIKRYVLGFAFDKQGRFVVLIEKQKPEWQKDKFNGVGGKVEDYDACYEDAMEREFYEETGVSTTSNDWQRFADMTFLTDVMGGTAVVHFFRIFTDNIFDCKTIEAEKIGIYGTVVNTKNEHWNSLPVIKNLFVLIPMAKDRDFNFADINVL